jgi:hypothetical protein
MMGSHGARLHPALRATVSQREKEGGAPSPFGRRWTRAARPDEGCWASRPHPTLETRGRTGIGQRKCLALISTVLTVAAFTSGCVPETKTETSPDCVARVNKAALQAMKRTRPLGQMMISSLPAAFGPHLLRVEVGVYGARTEMYAVDVTIDNACNVLGASTRLETNEWPTR